MKVDGNDSALNFDYRTLPNNWTWVELSNIGEWSSGGTPSRKQPENFGGDIPWVKIGDLSDGPVTLIEEKITKIGFQRSAAKMISPGALLVAMYGASIGKLGITKIECTTNQAIACCNTPPGISAEYVFYYLRSVRNQLVALGQGGAQPNISQAILKHFHLPLAPAKEQSRIVSKIDELFSRIEAGEKALERAKALVERYRKSVLKAAVTGELTRGWREQNKGKIEPANKLLERILKARRGAWEQAQVAKRTGNGIEHKEAAPPDTSELPKLPDGWVWASFAQLGDFGRGKSKHRPRNDPKLFGGSYPFLQTGIVRQSNGRIREFDSTYNEVGLAQSRLWPSGTICITIAANIASSGILEFAACFPDSVVGLVPHEEINGEYVEFFIRTVRDELERYAPATAQKNINLEILGGVAVPLPPKSEQSEIMSRAGQIISNADHLLSELDRQFKAASGVRQSVLKSAFEGRLVLQDPNDEPASALLARIREKRSAPAHHGTVRPRRGSKSRGEIRAL